MKNLRDQLAFANMSHIADSAFALMDRVQELKARTAVPALAALLVVICDRVGLDVRQELDRAAALVYDADHTMRDEYAVVRDVIDAKDIRV